MRMRSIIVAGTACVLLLAGAALAQEDDPEIGGKPLSEILKQLKSENKGLQLRAAKALVEAPLELRPKMMPRMMELLKSERDVFTTVVWAIGEIGPVNENVVPNLVNRLEKTLYGEYGGFAVGAVSFCVGDITEGTTEEYRFFVYKVLAKFGVKSKSAVPLMVRCINEGDWYAPHRIRRALGACMVLRAVGPEAKEALPALEKAVQVQRFDDRIPAGTVEAFKKEAQTALEAVRGAKEAGRDPPPASDLQEQTKGRGP